MNSFTTANLPQPPTTNRRELMLAHQREAEAALAAFGTPQGLPLEYAAPLAMIALAHAQMAVHYSPRPKRSS